MKFGYSKATLLKTCDVASGITVCYGPNFDRKTILMTEYELSRDMTKPTKWLCAQRRLRSAWASAQSDQSLRCPHEERLGP